MPKFKINRNQNKKVKQLYKVAKGNYGPNDGKTRKLSDPQAFKKMIEEEGLQKEFIKNKDIKTI
jgi:hypothetical protein